MADAVLEVVNPPSPVTPNLLDFETASARFRWADARSRLDGLPGGGLNIAHEAVDRHAAGPRADHVALRLLDKRGGRHDVSYRQLSALTNRFANVLDDLDVGPGDAVFFLLPRVLDLYVGVLGTLKHRSVACSLFSAFGPEPIHQRLERGRGRVLVTSRALYERKVAEIASRLPDLRVVLIIDEGDPDRTGDTVSLPARMSAASDSYTIAPTDPEEPALLHFTSGTTGMPKGAVHVHGAVVAHQATGTFALDLHADDVYWCTADPGWVTGTSYGIVAPLTLGVTSIIDEAEFDADRWYETIQRERVTVWYTAPTAIRMLMRVGADVARSYDLSSLRVVASVGEPLNPEGVLWGIEAFGRPIHDNWWQTETGGIMVANTPGQAIRPGSMGRPLPGVEAAIVQCDDGGRAIHPTGQPEGVVVLTEPGREGLLALRTGWPSMFRMYLHDPERYRACFAGDWYLSGDLAKRDADGYFWFIGRADDVIKTAGHLIGPFEVEKVLTSHPAVAEAAAYGVPDPVAGNVVHAVVVLRRDRQATDRELLAHARSALGAAVAPRQIVIADTLPRTKSGKILRRLLRARELGLPEGDLSTLEQPA